MLDLSRGKLKEGRSESSNWTGALRTGTKFDESSWARIEPITEIDNGESFSRPGQNIRSIVNVVFLLELQIIFNSIIRACIYRDFVVIKSGSFPDSVIVFTQLFYKKLSFKVRFLS